MARLCSAGLATIAELEDLDGPWSKARIESMLPMATEIELKRELSAHRSTVVAVANMFDSTASVNYTKGIQRVLDEIRVGQKTQDQIEAELAEARQAAARNLADGFARIGVGVRPKKGGKKK